MKAHEGHIDELLVKYLAGEASDAEHGQVQQWIKESEGNQQYFAHYELLWNESKAAGAESTMDTDAAWMRFRQRTQQKTIALPRPTPAYRWLKVAAMLVLLVGASWVAYYSWQDYNQPQPMATVQPKPNPVNEQLPAENIKAATPVAVEEQTTAPTTATSTLANANAGLYNNGDEQKSVAPVKAVAMNTQKAHVKSKVRNKNYTQGLFSYNRTKDFICNNTPCPIEICIIQTIKCANGEPSAVSTCSILEPDESGQLRYKAFDKITRNCNATVDEIRIKRVSTGETLVLNSESKPTTAQEFFSYITGQKKGGVTAGVFHTDCNNNKDDCGLTFNNSDLILQ